MGRAGRVFAQLATNPYQIRWSFFNPQPTQSSSGFVGSDCRRVVISFGWTRLSLESFETWRDLVRSGEILPDPSKIRWDPVGFCEISAKSWWEIAGSARSDVYCARNQRI